MANDHQSLADEFVTDLEGLREDRAALAKLKRCAGRTLAECPEVYPLFYRYLPAGARGPRWLEEPFFLVATLFPLAPERHAGDLGSALRSATERDPRRGDALDRRMMVLLDASREELPFRLRQMVRLLSSLEGAVDWRQLLVDLLQWEHPDRPAQKRWARNYFGRAREKESAGTASPNA